MKSLNVYSLTKGKTDFVNTKIMDSKQSADYIRQFFGDDIGIFESCFILLLNRNNTTIGYAKISQGGVCGTVVDIKIIAKYVIDFLASVVIVCHNHPSGSLRPSRQDIELTTKLKGALALLDTVLIDHIILTEEGFYSIADNEGI